MATNQAQRLQTPQQKAILGTALAFFLLLIVGGVGFWYGQQSKKADATLVNNNSSTNTLVNTTITPNKPLAATVTKINTSSLEVRVGGGDVARQVTANITKDTSFRKLDFRNTQTSSGSGIPISMADLKIGNSIVVVSNDTTGNVVEASKIILFIYP